MKINRPTEAIGKAYYRTTGEDPWSMLEMIAMQLKGYNDEPCNESWGDQYEITVTVRKM